MSLKALFYAYILGGLTFLPLVVAGLIYFTIYTSVPVGDPDVRKNLRAKLEGEGEGEAPDDAGDAATLAAADINDTPKTRKGWLTMRRTYEESSADSGYVNLVRSFLDARSKDPKRSRPKDMWYVALKGKILYLYEDEGMTECEAAIELGSHDVTVYPEGLPDGELFAKRNAICLKPKLPPKDKAMPSVTKEMDLENVNIDAKVAESGAGPRKSQKERDFLAEEARRKEAAREEALDLATPWFIFVRSNAEMEDWYLALIHASDHPPQTPLLAPLQAVFQPSEMNHLVTTLDEQPDVIPMRWLNALIGRIFFSFYRTHNLEENIIRRLMKKLSKVKRPAFLTDIVVTEVSVGTTAPTLSKPMLKELTKEGDASLEVHLQYKGEFRITVEATASINLGSRFKPYLVKLVLAAVLKEIEGNLLIKVKRPPSNRIWYAFTQTPRMVFEVEPIVSDRQITWGMITSTLESSLKQIIQESVVMPNMDDIAFFETSSYMHRGGIWPDAARREKPPTSVSQQVPDDASVASAPLSEPSVVEPDASGLRSTQPAAELSRDTPPSPPEAGELSWSSSFSSGDETSRANKRKSWFSSVRSDDLQSLAEQDGHAEDDDRLQRGRSVDVDKALNPRSRSTPNASDATLPGSSEGSSDDSHLQPGPSYGSQPSSMWGHGKSNSVEEYSKPSSEPSTSLRNGSSPTASSFLSTLKSRDKQAISNTAKETMRKWGVNWSGLMKDAGSSSSSRNDNNSNNNNNGAGDEMPDHGSFVSRLRADTNNSTPQKARASYAEVRAAVAERRGKERGSEGSPGRASNPIPIPDVKRERAVTMQPRQPSQNGSTAESASSSSAQLKSGPPSISRSNTELQTAETPSTPSPIHVQPQAKMMTIPGIHASHRGEVMSMGYVKPKPPSPSPEPRAKNPAIQSVYRLWKSPASAETSDAAPEAASVSSSNSSSRSQTLDDESTGKPFPSSPSPARSAPPPLPPRTARTTSISHVSRPDLGPTRLSESAQPSASAALKSIANKDKRASLEFGLAPSSPPSRRSTLSERSVSASDRLALAEQSDTPGDDDARVQVPALSPGSNPGPPLPPRRKQ
ncbi:hypothetical protein B0H17DRAFT_1099735 [Mycena rosella]|uniref:SMP-LTD domain-containing protein n=1 Tax=Mycena rosella TaxID=1033263 RepID=A0AAD7CN98_MYCRO|nr:hypothetical protein B0H17DRAFT_1099735 [Mycena rosella]